MKESFYCRAIIITTINDYPAAFSLNGQIKGKTGCLVCLDATRYLFLDFSKKIVYLKYRRFLVRGHRYRKPKYNNHFDGHAEVESAPRRRHDGKYVFEMVKSIRVCYGKSKNNKRNKPPIEGVPFKKKSIFYEYLPYWKDLEVPHAIDAMHVKKICVKVLLVY